TSYILLTACLSIALRAVFAQPSHAQDVLHRAHAHNDYEHDRPLLDALDRGFGSIEVDVFLVDGALLVAHDLEDVRADRTLRSLYLDPLRERVQAHDGSVYGEGTPVLLLVDVKSEAEPTYEALRSVLREYAGMLTRFERSSAAGSGETADGGRATEETIEGAVTVVISGNRARSMMRAEDVRLAAYDGRMEDLEQHADVPPSFIPLVSIPWYGISSWRGEGAIPDADLDQLRRLVAAAHEQGRMIRFWATADTSTVWDVLTEENVDLIGADDLEALGTYLRSR
ncbi:MAG: phosphatidylinositol-specific phospholipase C/glycerophosphodiester phosphodiesterase family protein, partial [Rhodothermales bacterium]